MDKRVAIITGGRRGIGLAITQAFQQAGIFTVVVAKSAEGPGDLYVQADLTDADSRAFLIPSIEAKCGPVDILVNCAGAQMSMPALTTSDESVRNQLELMLVAPFDLCKQAAISMRERGGHIVNILSVSAFQGARNIAGYVAAKHALLGLTRALAIEWAPEIHVNAVAPGLTETDMTAEFIPAERRAFLEKLTPSGRFSRPEEIAQAVMFLVQSENIYGQTITVDGGWMVKNG